MPVETPLLQRVSLGFLTAFLFMMFSRVFDVGLSWLHLPGISFHVMEVFLVITGAFLAAFRGSIGKCMLGFTFWFIVCIPFSVWKAGSVETFTGQWLVGIVVFMATASLISDFQQYARTAKTMALASVVLTGICLTKGSLDNGRLFLEQGRFANPNEMAQALLLGMPFCWALYSTSRSQLAKVSAALSIVLMAYVISKTGSRGALISIGILTVVMFVRASVAGKAKLLVSTFLLFLIAATLLPQSLRTRYATFFTADEPESSQDDADANMLTSAVGSAQSRKELFIRSLVLTAKHPVFGVGPGMFMVAEDAMAKAAGARRGSWLGTHNSFTQVSSECGIPGFLFYSAVVVLAFRKSYALYRRTKNRPEWRAVSVHALALNYSFIAFIGTGMFVHAAYTSLLPVLAGLTVSLVRTAEPLLARGAAPEAAPIYAWPAPYRVPAPRWQPARSS